MNVIFEGKLVNSQQLFHVQVLTKNHINEILSLQQIVVDSLENKESLQPLTKEEYSYIIEGHGIIIGVFVEAQLIAFRALLVPIIDDEHLGYDIGFNTEELSNIIYQEISIVHPSYRGNGLQKTLASIIMKELKNMPTKYTHVCCTVAPSNIPSLKDKFAQQMKIVALKKKYGDKVRYIFSKEITPNPNGKSDAIETTTLPLHDLTGQQYLLKKGWIGTELKDKNGEFVVLFEKVK